MDEGLARTGKWFINEGEEEDWCGTKQQDPDMHYVHVPGYQQCRGIIYDYGSI